MGKLGRKTFSSQIPMKVLVTSGATVPFEKLIRSSLSEEVLNELITQGYNQITIQYGKGIEIFNESREQLRSVFKITIEGFDFTNDMNNKIKEYDLVISHAGTGSILDALRANKRLITVINTKLMDNHQAEIAGEFERQGHLLSSEPENLVEVLRKVPRTAFIPLPPVDGKKLAYIVNEEAGI